jgi:hypothetical protein
MDHSMVTAAVYITDNTLVKRVPHRKLKCPDKEADRLNNLIREYLPGCGPTENTEHTFCTFNTAVVKAINEIKPFRVHRSKGPARLKIHNDVRALGQILRCIQREMPIPKTLLHLPVYSKIKYPTAATVKKTLR